MSVLWAGGEDLSFQNGTLPTVNTSGGNFRSGYTRCALQTVTSGPAKGNQFSGGAITSAWFSCRAAILIGGANIGIFGAGLYSSSGKGLYVACASTTSYFGIYTSLDGITLTALATSTTAHPGGTPKIDMQITSYGATATVNVYVNGALIVTFTGDVRVSGMTNFDCVSLPICNPSNPAQAAFISEVIVADEDTRTFSLVSMAGTGAGDTDDWTGAYTDCNPITINDANAVYTATAAKDEQFNITDLPSGTFSVKACLVAARAEKTSGSPIGTLKLGWKTGGTVNVDAGRSLTTAWATYERLALLNPVTATNWLQSEMNALQEDLQSAT
jgi:hypothetical protein